MPREYMVKALVYSVDDTTSCWINSYANVSSAVLGVPLVIPDFMRVRNGFAGGVK